MVNNNANINKKDDVPFGIGLSFSFIFLAIFIYMYPEYLGGSTVTIIFSSICILIGVMGLGIELNKLNERKNSGFDNLGIGLGLLFLWAILHYFFPYLLVNWLILIILFFAIIGIMSGLANLISNIMTAKTKKKLLVEIPIIITQLGATIIAIYKILVELKLI
ncbi:hypothetical protein FIU87_21155 [Bacillus sp. THAF10]|uniref:hypothetical protein n=1 Tax=Bacillus sp. THAF10 TaxID=2587848 RepID=UPI0012692E32|nr:hypothetical protein [Bacillus sp. THAF10]QFT91163.1 hypothetical protein FIU87_21155 [Bacillus sp. THAF10]